MIISGGENVYPAEVENVLMANPLVADVAVIGVPSERWGETVKALVVPAAGTAPDEAELIAFCRERLAHYKCPTSVELVDALPRNPTGKVLKHELRAPLLGRTRSTGELSEPMQKLNHQDATFLYSEKDRAPMHLCSFHVYEPDASAARPPDVRRVPSTTSAADCPLARVLRRRLERVPLDLDYPYWIEDREFDLDHHVHHLTLDEPGDWRALWDLAARLHSVPVDLRRPPWELYLIDGIDDVDGYAPGSFAMLIKIHHCAIDGIVRHRADERPARPRPGRPRSDRRHVAGRGAARLGAARSRCRWRRRCRLPAGPSGSWLVPCRPAAAVGRPHGVERHGRRARGRRRRDSTSG